MVATTTEVPPFDTRAVAAEVREAGGFSQKQADAIVVGIARATTNLATRADLDTALERQTAELRTEIHKAINGTHKVINGQTWRFIAAMGAMLGLLRWLFPVGTP